MVVRVVVSVSLQLVLLQNDCEKLKYDGARLRLFKVLLSWIFTSQFSAKRSEDVNIRQLTQRIPKAIESNFPQRMKLVMFDSEKIKDLSSSFDDVENGTKCLLCTAQKQKISNALIHFFILKMV